MQYPCISVVHYPELDEYLGLVEYSTSPWIMQK